MTNVKALVYIAVLCVYSVVCSVAGYLYHDRHRAEAIIEQLEDDEIAVAEARIEYIEIEKEVKVYVDVIKIVQDDTGCFDVSIPILASDSLLESYRTATRPQTYRTL